MRSADGRFKVGDAVVIAAENPAGNPRTPLYIRGKRGVIGAVHGFLENVRDHRGIHPPLYTVRFDLGELSACQDPDSIWVDVHEDWLRPAQTDALEAGPARKDH
ncbi:MAG TPA: SH3-like domain-containing protein [Candidatus Eisenbacteria bacterium]|nr:SH3-like domain-containing protein [Candidatus Eisenbacteria bacterium]